MRVIKLLQKRYMKLLFLGCSWTWGDELQNREKDRYSSIIGKKLNADVVNLAENGFSNHAIARIFLDQNLDQYDYVFVQLTHPSRAEFFDKDGITADIKNKRLRKKLAKIYDQEKAKLKYKQNIFKNKMWQRIMPNVKRFMETGYKLDGKEWWELYYEEIYHDKFGDSEELLIYSLIRNRLTILNKKHFISSINPKCKVPVDLLLNNPKYPRAQGNHPTNMGHLMIASDIMKLL